MAVDELTGEERDIVALVREFVDHEVRPVARELCVPGPAAHL